MDGLVLSPFQTWAFIVLSSFAIGSFLYRLKITDYERREVLRERLHWQQLAREEVARLNAYEALKSVPHPDLYDYEKEEQRVQYVGMLVHNGYTKEMANAEFERLWAVLTTTRQASDN